MNYICKRCGKPCEVIRDVYLATGLFIPAKVYVWSRCCETGVEVSQDAVAKGAK